MTGWISLHRKVRDNWLFAEKRSFSKFEAWVDLLMEVNHQDNKFLLGNELIDVKRGQKVTSMKQLSERWCWSKDKTYKFVKLLESEQMLEVKSNTKRTVITIVNYDCYQLHETQKHTPTEHKNYANSTPTDTNNNDNNDNNENKINHYNSELEKSVDLEEQKDQEIIKQNAFNFYEQNFGMINSFIVQEIEHWVNDFNDDVVIEAMKRSLEQQKKWNYAKRILANWINRNVKTIEDIKALDVEFEKRKQRPVQTFKKPIRQEIVPDWIDGQTQSPERDSLQIEAERKRLEEELQMFKRKKEV
ncbi:DnaD domain protein [Arthrobacter citreus]|nr:DnaD domain protein [Arthrobacter citreus]